MNMNDNELNNEKAYSPDNMENALQDVLADAGSPEHGRKDWQHRVQVEDDKASDHDTGSSPTEEVPADTDSKAGKDKPKVSFWEKVFSGKIGGEVQSGLSSAEVFLRLDRPHSPAVPRLQPKQYVRFRERQASYRGKGQF